MRPVLSITLATLVLIVVLLPGAFATWGFQRHRQWYGHRTRDWFVRMAGFSALFWMRASWPIYWFLSTYHRDIGRLKPVSPWLVVVPVLYLGVPLGIGVLLGFLSKRDEFKRWLSPRRHPSAWDYLFGEENAAFVRCRLDTGEWVGGFFTLGHWTWDGDTYAPTRTPSYVGTDGESFDLFISDGVHLDQGTGEPLWDDYGRMARTRTGILVEQPNVAYLEFKLGTPAEEDHV